MSETYSKDDYLTPIKYASKYGLAKEIVEKAMKIARLRHASITLNCGGTKREIIISQHGKHHVRPEPTAHDALNKIIQEIQSKGESK